MLLLLRIPVVTGGISMEGGIFGRCLVEAQEWPKKSKSEPPARSAQ